MRFWLIQIFGYLLPRTWSNVATWVCRGFRNRHVLANCAAGRETFRQGLWRHVDSEFAAEKAIDICQRLQMQDESSAICKMVFPNDSRWNDLTHIAVSDVSKRS